MPQKHLAELAHTDPAGASGNGDGLRGVVGPNASNAGPAGLSSPDPSRFPECTRHDGDYAPRGKVLVEPSTGLTAVAAVTAQVRSSVAAGDETRSGSSSFPGEDETRRRPRDETRRTWIYFSLAGCFLPFLYSPRARGAGPWFIGLFLAYAGLHLAAHALLATPPLATRLATAVSALVESASISPPALMAAGLYIGWVITLALMLKSTAYVEPDPYSPPKCRQGRRRLRRELILAARRSARSGLDNRRRKRKHKRDPEFRTHRARRARQYWASLVCD